MSRSWKETRAAPLTCMLSVVANRAGSTGELRRLFRMVNAGKPRSGH
jgi:hypothetical protein